MTMTLGDIRKELVEGLYAVDTVYKQWPIEAKEIYARTIHTKKDFEQVVRKQTFGAAQLISELEAPSLSVSKELYTTTYTMQEFGAAYQISRRALKSNLYMRDFDNYNEQLKNAFLITKETQAVVPLNLAFTASATQSDGVPLCSTQHPIAATGGVQANTFTTPVDLGLTPLEMALIKIGQTRDEGGNFMALKAKKLLVGTLNTFVADVILDTKTDPTTANRAKNPVMRDMFGRASVPDGYRVNHYMVNAKDWFIMTDLERGVKHFECESLELQVSPSVINFSFRVKGYECYVFGFDDWRAIFGVSGLGNMFGNLI